MRRMLTVALAVGAGALMMSPLVSAAGAKRPARQRPEKIFRVFDFGHNHFLAVGGANPKKPTPGDEIIINGHLTLPFAEDGKYKIIGHVTGTCTITRVGRKFGGLANCLITAVVPHGSIAAQGQIKFARHSFSLETSHLAITGGTGGFRDAGGAVQIKPTKHYTVLTFTVR